MQIQPPYSYYTSRHSLCASLPLYFWLLVTRLIFFSAQLHVARYVCVDTCMISQRTYSTARAPPARHVVHVMRLLAIHCSTLIVSWCVFHLFYFGCTMFIPDWMCWDVGWPARLFIPFACAATSQRLSHSIFFFSTYFFDLAFFRHSSFLLLTTFSMVVCVSSIRLTTQQSVVGIEVDVFATILWWNVYCETVFRT